MTMRLILEYWRDDGWYVGRIKGVPGVFSQGATLQELEANIREAYSLMLEESAEDTSPSGRVRSKEIRVNV